MIIFNGFWTGVVEGFLLAFCLISIISMRLSAKKEKNMERLTRFMEQVNKVAKEKIDESKNQEDSH